MTVPRSVYGVNPNARTVGPKIEYTRAPAAAARCWGAVSPVRTNRARRQSSAD